ncbi:MAG TPA: fused MFS/spermidine synthase [Phycisphaerae bacterium]|nr:fused MFS/spermidine synthase [Phycisphaerae bacterium]
MGYICLVLFFLSGCASLIYEVAWTRQFALVLGSSTYAITTVVVSFMGGLAWGSFIAGSSSAVLRKPGRIYGILEAAIGVWALLVPAMVSATEPLYRALYPYVSDAPTLLFLLRVSMSLAVLIVPTTLMGATLPILMTHVTRSATPRLGRSAGLLYGINTLGAAAGCVWAGFGLMPACGLFRTTVVAAVMNLFVAVVAWVFLRDTDLSEQTPAREGAKHGKRRVSEPLAVAPGTLRLAMVVAAASGLASMIYQIAWTRALIMSLGSSTYSFSCILAAFILGLAVGSLVMARFADRFVRPLLVLGLCELGIAISAVLIVPIHGRIPGILRSLVALHSHDYSTLLRLEFLLVVAVTFVPTFLMGAVFPVLTRVAGQHLVEPGRAVARVYAINTIGSMAGCVLAGFVLIRGDVLGVRNSILAAALLNGILGVWLLIRSLAGRQRGWAVLAGTIVGACFAFGMVGGRWSPDLLTSGPFRRPDTLSNTPRKILFYEEGVDLTVAVEQAGDDPDQLSLTVNGKPDASTHPRDVRTQLLVGHLPALLGPESRPACVVGLGSGMTLAAVAKHRSYSHVDCLEISDSVIRAAAFFAPFTEDVLAPDPRIRILREDGRNHLLLTREQYGLIVSEPSNPWISGVSSLFTREFFDLCRQRLTGDGCLAVWLHTYSMSREDFRMVVRTLNEVFPFVTLWRLEHTDFCLVAGNQPFRVPAATVLERYGSPAVRADLFRAGIRDLAGVLGTFVSGGAALREWASSAPLHTDDNLRLEFSAPRHLYTPGASLNAELTALTSSPFDEMVVLASDEPRIQYLKARTDAVLAAHAALVRASQEWRDGKRVEALDRLIRAYEQDLGNRVLYDSMWQYVSSLEAKPLSGGDALQECIARFRRLPPPIHVSLRGESLAQIAQTLFRSGRRSQRTFLPGALVYLTEAHDISPQDGAIAAALSMAWVQAGNVRQAEQILGRFLQSHPEDGWANYGAAVLAVQRGSLDEAIALARRALASGTITPSQLASDPKLDPLEQIVDFEKLAAELPNTRPG